MEDWDLLICNSNMFVPYVMSECLENKNKKFIVVTDTPNINKFFKMLMLDNIELFSYGTGTISSIHNEKVKIKSFLLNYNVKKVVFYHAEYGELANWLIVSFAKAGVDIEYHKVFDSIPVPKARWYQGWKIRLKQWLCFNYFPDILNDGSRLFPSLPKKFYMKVKARIVVPKLNQEIVSACSSNLVQKLGMKGKVLFVSGSIVADNIVSKMNYEVCINQIIDIIGVDNASVKLHPRYSDLIGKETILCELPKFIPGNLILDCFDLYIGYFSTLLVEAAHKGKKVISTLYLMQPQSVVSQQRFHQYLNNRLGGKGTILFPKTMSEFKDILLRFENQDK